MHKKIDVYVCEALELNLVYFMYPMCDGWISFFIVREITPRSLGEISSELVRPKGEVALWAVNLDFLKQVHWTDAFIVKTKIPATAKPHTNSKIPTQQLLRDAEQVSGAAAGGVCAWAQAGAVTCQHSVWHRAQGEGHQSHCRSSAGTSQTAEL